MNASMIEVLYLRDRDKARQEFYEAIREADRRRQMRLDALNTKEAGDERP